MARELSQDVVSMGGAHADLGETRQAFRRRIELAAHLRGPETDVLATTHVGEAFQNVNSRLETVVQSGEAVGTAPA